MLIKKNRQIFNLIFYFFSVVLAWFFVSEMIWPNSILVYVNLNYVIVLWLISWLLLL